MLVNEEPLGIESDNFFLRYSNVVLSTYLFLLSLYTEIVLILEIRLRHTRKEKHSQKVRFK